MAEKGMICKGISFLNKNKQRKDQHAKGSKTYIVPTYHQASHERTFDQSTIKRRKISEEYLSLKR